MEAEPQVSSPGREVPVFEQEKGNLADPKTADDVAVTQPGDRSMAHSSGSSSNGEYDGGDPYTCCCVWKPRWAQKCISPVFFLVCVCLIVCCDAVSIGVFTGGITSIIIRYRLTAANLGVLVTAYSAGNLVALPFMSYFGGRPRTSRPRWIACGTVVIAVGTLLNALPQFVFGKYDAVLSNGQMEGLVCTADSDSDQCDAFQTVGDQNNAAFWIMMCGSVVSGVGYATIPTLSLSYIDDNCRTETTALYLGIIESMYGIGTMFGFFISSYSLSLWVDFYRLDPGALLPTPWHPAWVGAWWLGLLICSLFFLLTSLPLFGFPRRLPSRFRKESEPKKGRQTGLTEVQTDGEGEEETR